MNFSKRNLPTWVPIFIAKRSDQGTYHRPFICLAAAFLPGVAAGAALPGFLFVAGALLLASAAFVAIRLKQGKCAVFLPPVLFFILGYLAIQPWSAPHFPDHHIIRYADGQAYTLKGVVTSRPRTDGRRTRFILKTETIESSGTVNPMVRPVTGRIRMSCYGMPGQLHKGDGIVLKTRVRLIRNFNNPGGFDYERYMAYQGVHVSGYAKKGDIGLAADSQAPARAAGLQRLRNHVAAMIDQMPFTDNDLTTPVRPVMKALLLGDKSGLTPALRGIFNRSGTSHLLAISGLHVGIVAGVSFFILRWLLSLVRPLLWSGRVKTAAAVLSILPVLGYGLVAGLSPSTQRAVIMVIIFLMTFPAGRGHDLINTLAVAALAIVAVHPPTLFSISFQLSFTAVFFIVYGFARFLPSGFQGEGVWRFLLAKGGTLLMVSVFATLGTLPIVMHAFNQISLVGVIVNVVAVPLVGFMVVPAGLISMLAALVFPSAGMLGFAACAHVLAVAMQIINFFSGIPPAAVKTVTPGMLEIAGYYVILWGLFTLLPVKRTPAGGSSTRRWVKTAVLAAVVILAGDVLYWTHARFLSKDLRVTILDVGQGSAALLELPGGYNLLADGGGFSDNAAFDVGERIVAPYLWQRKIRTIDSIVLSHPNSDHLNGLTYIAEHFNVKNAWTNGETSRSKGYGIFSETLKRNKVSWPGYDALDRRHCINGVCLEILYPEKDFLERRDAEPWRSANNNSLVLKVSYGQHALLFPGDLQADGEAAIGRLAGSALASTILIAPHHGSKSSSTQGFINQVNPEIVVISAGWRNRFKFPHPAVLKRYERSGSRVFRTDLDGAVRLISDGKTLRVLPTISREAENR
jgi:competence protein ComEC